MTDEDDHGYTASHPVAVNLACEQCKMTLSGDHAPGVLREMFEKAHNHAA